MPLSNSIKANIFFSIALTLSNILIPLVSFPYASHLLGPSGIGKVQFAQTFVQYFSFLAALGVPTYGIRAIAKSKNNDSEQRKVFSNLVFLNLIFSFFFLLIYALIIFNSTFLYQDLKFYIIGAVPILLSFSNVDWYFSGLEKFRLIAIRSILAKLLSTILIFVLVLDRNDELIYFFLISSSVLLNNIFNIISLRKLFSLKEVKRKEILLHIKPLLLIFSMVIAGSIYSAVDVIILGRLKGFVQVGYYSAASKITKMVIPILTAISAALLPRLSFEIQNANISEGKKMMQKSLEITFLLGIPIVFGVSFLAPELVKLIAGSEFLPAVIAVQLMAPVILIISISTICSVQILLSHAKDVQNAISIYIGLFISVVLNFFLMPRLGYIGATISNLCSELAVMIMFLIFSSRLIKLNFNWRDIIKSILISCFFLLIIEILRKFILINSLLVISSIILCSIWYFSLHFFVTKNEIIKKEITNLLKLR
jgi:O-antigen/teichoic acid export membrane protein